MAEFKFYVGKEVMVQDDNGQWWEATVVDRCLNLMGIIEYTVRFKFTDDDDIIVLESDIVGLSAWPE